MFTYFYCFSRVLQTFVCQQKKKRIVLVSWVCCREINSLTVLEAWSPNYGVGWAMLPSSEGEFFLASSIFWQLQNSELFLCLYMAFFLVPESRISCPSLRTTPIIGCVVFQSLSCVQLFVTRWTAARQAPLFSITSWSWLRLMSIGLVMLSKHIILCCPLLLLPSSFSSIWVFAKKNQLFISGGPSIGASASASVLPVNIQGCFPLGLTGLISLLLKGLSRVFSSTAIWKHQFFSAQPSLWSSSHINTWLLEKIVALTKQIFVRQSDVFSF